MMMLVRERARRVRVKASIGGWVHKRIVLDAKLAAGVAARERTNDVGESRRIGEVMPMDEGREEGTERRWYHAVAAGRRHHHQ